MLRWRRSVFTIPLLLLLAAAFVVVNALAGRWFYGDRIDLTQDRLYTLTPGTLQVLDGLREPIELTLYFSERASRGLPELRGYQQRVRETLEEMARNADGLLQFRSIDPQPYTDDEDRAVSAGLTSVPVGVAGERVLFGLVGSSGGGAQAVIPFFQPSKEAFLEYDLAKLVHDLSHPMRPRIGVITSLPMDGEDMAPGAGARPWAILTQLRQQFRVRRIAPQGLTRIDPSLRLLVLASPRGLDEAGLHAIDDYVMAGGHLLAFVDPEPEQLRDSSASDDAPLARLLHGWGVAWNPEMVVLDRARALAITPGFGATPVRHPAVLGLTGSEMSPNDVVTTNLRAIDVSTAGVLDVARGAEIRLEPLLQSSADAMLVSRSRLRAADDSAALYADYLPSGTHYLIAARVAGRLPSAFGSRAIDAPQVVLVADSDLLSDRLWVRVTRFFGEELYDPFANNGDFILNLVDNLTGSTALISVRGHTSVQRPFTRVLALRRDTDAHFRERQQALQDELGTIDRELVARERLHDDDPDHKTQQEQLLKRKLAIRDELREVQRRLDADIVALGTRLELIDIVLWPSGVALVAALLLGWRARRRRPRAR